MLELVAGVVAWLWVRSIVEREEQQREEDQL